LHDYHRKFPDGKEDQGKVRGFMIPSVSLKSSNFI
jgi:hypothetical protein